MDAEQPAASDVQRRLNEKVQWMQTVGDPWMRNEKTRDLNPAAT